MSVSYIPEKTKMLLWGKAAGRCEYDGCNKPLWLDDVTKHEFNTAYIAHIISDKPDGPRGDPIFSPKLKSSLTNLILLCDEHHRLIDREQVEQHPVSRLQAMKEQHEQRIELLSSIRENKRSHVLLFGANIGTHTSPVSWERTVPAMLPQWYPAEKPAIELGLKNSAYLDAESDYWQIELENLRRLFFNKVKPRLSPQEILHLSIFGLAPQPLLMELGRLISDTPMAQVYQLHREPPDWIWQDDSLPIEYQVRPPKNIGAKTVALVLSLSATITPDRIASVLGKDLCIWEMTIEHPNNDFLKSREQLSEFRKAFRKLLDLIKAEHGQNTILHIFPAVPVSVAVEIGRVWMPKADMKMRIYDQNTGTGGFSFALEIS